MVSPSGWEHVTELAGRQPAHSVNRNKGWRVLHARSVENEHCTPDLRYKLSSKIIRKENRTISKYREWKKNILSSIFFIDYRNVSVEADSCLPTITFLSVFIFPSPYSVLTAIMELRGKL